MKIALDSKHKTDIESSISMKLRDRNRSPVNGFYYDDPIYGNVTVQGNFDKLVLAVASRYKANGKPIPNNLAALIEDQICMRQPPDRCYYTKGLGDQIAMGVHKAAAAVDSLLGTNLQKKARGCGGCAKRRMSLNSR